MSTQVVQECTGYSSVPPGSLWHLPWLTWHRLVFWVLIVLRPQHAACMLCNCGLERAEYVLVKVQQHIQINLTLMVRDSRADIVSETSGCCVHHL